MKTSYFKYLLIPFVIWLFSLSAVSQTTRMKKPELKSFLNAHMQYPEDAFKNKEQGTVTIQFTTDEEGIVISRKVIKKVSPQVDKAALNLFDLILWSPATKYGISVKGTSEFKLKYSVSKYKLLVKQRGYDRFELPYKPIDDSREIYSVKNNEDSPKPLLDSIYQSVQAFISSQLVYPESARKFSIQGVVKLRFIIETNGLPSNVMVVDAVGGGCTEEAIRVTQLIKWRPGIKENKAVRTCYTLSIKFDPADELRNKHIPNQSNIGI